jgi:hypothetical protein
MPQKRTCLSKKKCLDQDTIYAAGAPGGVAEWASLNIKKINKKIKEMEAKGRGVSDAAWQEYVL